MKKRLIFLALAGFIGATPISGFTANVSETDCQKALDHMVDIIAEQAVKDQKMEKAQADTLVKTLKEQMKTKVQECTKEAKRSEIDCILKAKKFEEIEKCDQDSKSKS